MKDPRWDLLDIVIVPEESSDVNSRSECDVFIDFNDHFMLPLMCAPMDTVVSTKNYLEFINNGIIPCFPRKATRTLLPREQQYFQSFGLCDIEKELYEYKINNKSGKLNWSTYIYKDYVPFYEYPNVLIDIANGHLSKLVQLVIDIKHFWPNMNLMVGNVANPETFVNLGLAGVDFVRVGVGNGNACVTSANTGVNYPMGSLISECYELRKQYDIKTKIVADGGMQNYSDIIKVLCVGADCVMVGSLFNKSIESAGFNYLYNIKISYKHAELLWKWGFPVKKKLRGMSTKAVQRSWGKTHLTTSEGITKYQKVEYTLNQWTENFRDYLKSAMSYSNTKTLKEFTGKSNYVFITQNALLRFKK